MTNLPNDDELLSNAACCAQFRPLEEDFPETDESLRECIKLNVCKPLRQRIADLEDVAWEETERIGLLYIFAAVYGNHFAECRMSTGECICSCGYEQAIAEIQNPNSTPTLQGGAQDADTP